jgi:hypothetical protein
MVADSLVASEQEQIKTKIKITDKKEEKREVMMANFRV